MDGGVATIKASEVDSRSDVGLVSAGRSRRVRLPVLGLVRIPSACWSVGLPLRFLFLLLFTLPLFPICSWFLEPHLGRSFYVMMLVHYCLHLHITVKN